VSRLRTKVVELSSSPLLVGRWNGFQSINVSGAVSSLVNHKPGGLDLAQATVGRRPTFLASGWDGKPAIKLDDTDGTARGLRQNAIATSVIAGDDRPFSIYIVSQAWDARSATLKVLWQAYAAAGYTQVYETATSDYWDTFRRFGSATKTINGASPAGNGWRPGNGVKHCSVAEFNGTQGRLRNVYANATNDSGLQDFDINPISPTVFVIGCQQSFSANSTAKRILADIWIFSGVLNSAEDTFLLQELNKEWGFSNQP
jgi:hypothetical protein